MTIEQSVKRYFDELGSTVESQWHRSKYDKSVFGEIAEQVLRDNLPSEKVSWWDSLSFAFLADLLPEQSDIEAKFGQPPLTVYSQQKFRIELLFWTVGMPGIHQHSFSGAFHVMQGSSVHLQWAFDVHESIAKTLLLGRLRSTNVELLHKGDVRRIPAGDQFIHTTYHLDRPTVSVVIRTHLEEGAPGYGYLPPSFAVAAVNPALRRRKQMLNMLARLGKYGDLVEIVLRFIDTADLVSVFHCIYDSCAYLPSEVDRNRILRAGSKRHSKLVSAIPPTLLVEQRRRRVTALRERVRDPDLLFFLALLLNVPDRSSIVSLIRARDSRSDPFETIAQWVSELDALGLGERVLSIEHINALRNELLQQPLHVSVPGRNKSNASTSSTRSADELIRSIRKHWLFGPLVATIQVEDFANDEIDTVLSN